MKTVSKNNIDRYNPNFKNGLNSDQVIERMSHHLTNKTKITVGKSTWEIIKDNIFSFFNILLFIIGTVIIIRNINYLGQEVAGGYIQWHSDLIFFGILLTNIGISLYQDLKARYLMTKIRVITAPRVTVIRDSMRKEIMPSEIVLDDVIYLKADSQICADSILKKGTLFVNESLLTGEAHSINKKPGDTLYSGSYVVSGEGYAQVDKIGADSYIESITGKANKFKRSKSMILTSLKTLFRGIGIIVILIAIISLTLYFLKSPEITFDSVMAAVGPLSGSLVGMIPSGLYLLTSVALATSVITLAKRKAQVQDFYSIEMLSRTDVLCVDKTGTITDGTMEVKKVVPLQPGIIDLGVQQIVSNIVNATKDDNVTGKALKKYFTLESNAEASVVLPFNSENKYSAVYFKGVGTYLLGAPEFMNLKNKEETIKKVNQYASKGYRVLVLARGSTPLKQDKPYDNVVTAVALIIIIDHVRKEVVKTFKWFQDNGVEIKVISGDNVETVKEIARTAGIENADKYISLEGMSPDEVYEIAPNYTVFGRVTPEQKEAIIQSLRSQKKTVAMTGDGVNDILALKRADCSIAMASGAEAARNVSHIVLLDSNFDTLPEVVAEGRRVVNNLQRTCSLFLVKTVFVIALSIIALILKIAFGTIQYPFVPSNMYLWEIFAIGLASFFLALEPANEKVSGNFLGNIFKSSVPAAIFMLVPVIFTYILFALQEFGVLNSGVDSFATATAMSIIIISILSIFVLLQVCMPFSSYRAIVFGVSALAIVIPLTGAALSYYSKGIKDSLFLIHFELIEPINWLLIAVILIISVTVYFSIVNIIKSVKESKQND